MNLIRQGSFGAPEWMGYRIEVVPVGTEVTDERTGQREAVTEGATLVAGSRMYCTKATYHSLVKALERDSK